MKPSAGSCRARDRAPRGGVRVCGASTTTRVLYLGVSVPLCPRHLDLWHRWRQDAPATARALWGWPDAQELERLRAPQQLELEPDPGTTTGPE